MPFLGLRASTHDREDAALNYPVPRYLIATALVVSWTGSLCALTGQASAQSSSSLVDKNVAQRHGLDRSWFAQIALRSSHSQVIGWKLSKNELFVLTDSGVLQRIDAETGRIHWTVRIGNPSYPSLGPEVSDEFVALVNGSTLYVLNRADGRGHLTRQVGGGPGAGPALGQNYVFVPMIEGRIEGYSLHDTKEFPWFYQSFGRTLLPPAVSGQSLVWTTDEGFVYFARAEERGVFLRVETPNEFQVGPAFDNGVVYVASSIGQVYALAEENGRQLWQYSMEFPASGKPAIVADYVFVTSEKPALHCIDLKTGRVRWIAPNVLNFAAVSKTRVFGLDRSGSLVALDRESGSLLHRIPLGGPTMAVVNDQSDRIFLISPTGLVQCLYEIGAEKPTYYVHMPAEETVTEPAKEEPAAEESSIRDEETTSSESSFETPAAEDDEEKEPAAAPLPSGGEGEESDDDDLFQGF